MLHLKGERGSEEKNWKSQWITINSLWASESNLPNDKKTKTKQNKAKKDHTQKHKHPEKKPDFLFSDFLKVKLLERGLVCDANWKEVTMIRELCTTAFNKPQAGSPRTLLTSLQRAYSYNYSSSSASNFGMHNIYFVDFHNPRLMEVFCLHNNYQPTPISPKTSEWGRYLPKLIIIRHRGKNNHTLHAGAPEIIFFFFIISNSTQFH